ncbi:MAG: CapA family protein, partial [Longimicrobiales bacterium]
SIPFLNRPAMWDSIAARTGREMIGKQMDSPIGEIIYALEFDSREEEARYPFHPMRSLIREADVAFANLEMPLSDRARHTGAFLGDPVFADALRWAGFEIVSIANNHAFDGEYTGLMDTMANLERAGVAYVGGGVDLEDARKPHVIEVDGISIAFLAYAYGLNGVGEWGFANENLSGIMPIDPFLIKEDIRRIRGQVDYVAVSLHWAVENSTETHPAARTFAHDIIDSGADIILGHHPHVPRGVEAYKGKVIFYSLGNFIFGHGHMYWGDNYVARLTIAPDQITQVEILPISTLGNEMGQPSPLNGFRARTLLTKLQELTARLDTRMEIVGDRGVIRP